jgi:hypothetical protein
MVNCKLRKTYRKGVYMKFKYLIPILLIVVVFSLIGCTVPKQTVKETTATAVITVIETINNVELEDSNYVAEEQILNEMIITTMEKGSEAAFSFADGEITMAEHKILAAQNIKDTNEFYDFYLTLIPTDKYKLSHEQLGEAMKHFLNSSIYMQKYIDSEDMDEMVTYLGNATTELQLGTAYVKKATDEVSKLK